MKLLLLPILIFAFVTYGVSGAKYTVYGKGIDSTSEPLLTWDAAKKACADKGLKLAIPKSADDVKEIVAAIDASSVGTNLANFQWGGDDSGYNGVWLGLHKPLITPYPKYFNWRKDGTDQEPNGGPDSQKCIAIGYQIRGTNGWWDSPCGWKSPYVCGPGTSQTAIVIQDNNLQGCDGGVKCLLTDSKYDCGGAACGQIGTFDADDACACQKLCQANKDCVKFVYKTKEKKCKLKNDKISKAGVVQNMKNFVIGPKSC